MKKGSAVLLAFSAVFFALIIGIFIGRNTGARQIHNLVEYEQLCTNAITADESDPRLNINDLSAMQLQSIPGIGEVLAQRIVIYRESNGPFNAMDELLNVKGIGEKKLKQIESLLKVGS